MLKLIRSALYRYMHSRFLYVSAALFTVSAVIFALYIRNRNGLSLYTFLAQNIILSILISITVSGEFCGCTKNKIVCGSGRMQIFFSELLSAYIVVSAFFLINIALSAVLNTDFVSRLPVLLAFEVTGGFYLINLSLCSVFVFFSAVSGRKVLSVVLSVVFVFVSVIANGITEDLLRQPEYLIFYVSDKENEHISENGIIYEQDPGNLTEIKQKNPEYIGGAARAIILQFYKANPFYDITQYQRILTPYIYSDEKIEELSSVYSPGDPGYDNPTYRMRFVREETEEEQRFLYEAPLYCLAVIVLSVAAGALVFRKKKFN